MGIGGIVAFSIGGLMLFDSELEAFQVGLPTLGATAIVSALFIFATVNIALKMRNRAVTTGLDTIVGQTGQVLTNQDSKTQIRVGAEIWTVQSDDDLKQGDTVTVVAVDGLELQVSKSSQNQATTG